MSYEKTWLYNNTNIFKEDCPNGCIVAFNPSDSPLLRRQVESIAKELAYDYRIYENIRTDAKILEAAYAAYVDGYEQLFVLTETEKLTETERTIQEVFDFSVVQAFSEVISSRPSYMNKLVEAQHNLKPLCEANPQQAVPPQATPVRPAPLATPAPAPGRALLMVAALNAWPVRGTGQLIQEVLNLGQMAPQYVAKYLPNFTAWDRHTVHVRIYMRPPEATNSISVADRICMLADGGHWLGLYNQNGCGSIKLNPPLEEGDLWIPGNHKSNPLTKIREFTDTLGIGGTIVLAPQAQLSAVQTEFKAPNDIPVVALQTNVPDQPQPDLVALAFALSEEYSNKNLAAKGRKNVAPVKPTIGDMFTMQLIGDIKETGGRGVDEDYQRGTKTWSTRKGKGYFEGIWAAVPEGDKAFLKTVGEGTGIGDVFTIVNNVRKVGKAALGMRGEGEPKEKTVSKTSETVMNLENKVGFGIAEVINDPRFKQLKSALDLAD